MILLGSSKDWDSLTDGVLRYNSLFDGGYTESIYPLQEGLIKLKDGQVIILTSPSSDGGVVRMDKISNEYLIAYSAGHTWQNQYLISTDLKEITSLSSGGSVEVVDLENLIFKVKGIKSYWKKGGAFWFDAIIDKNGEIIKIDNSRFNVDTPKYSNCYSKNDFIKNHIMKADPIILWDLASFLMAGAILVMKLKFKGA